MTAPAHRLCLIALALASVSAFAQSSSTTATGTGITTAESNSDSLTQQSARMDGLGKSKGATVVEDKISSSFSQFAGSQQNANNLVQGLRNGTGITLTGTASDGTNTGTTFNPPTKPMGYGNVYTSLALAKQNLAAIGIDNPTPQQLEAALNGGTVTVGTGSNAKTYDMQGVLELRASGMGWGEIAKSYGYKLGPIVSGMKSTNTALAKAPDNRATRGAGRAPDTTETTEVSTAARGTAGKTKEAGRPTSAGTTGHAYGRGIVSANGAVVGNGVSGSHGYHDGKHVSAATGTITTASTAAGSHASANGAAHGQAGGNGAGKP